MAFTSYPVEIWFAAFIHKKVLNSTQWPGWGYEPGFGDGKLSGMGVSSEETLFRGDERYFAGHVATKFNSRLWSKITVDAAMIGALPAPSVGAQTRSRNYTEDGGMHQDIARGLVSTKPGCLIESWVGPSHQRVRTRDIEYGSIAVGMTVATTRTPKAWGPWKMNSKTAPNLSTPPVVRNPSKLSSEIDIECAASYPFSAVAPQINFGFTVKLTRSGTSKVEIVVDGWHNEFPYYELLVNQKAVYMYQSSSSGPSVINLNSTDDFEKTITTTRANGATVVVF